MYLLKVRYFTEVILDLDVPAEESLGVVRGCAGRCRCQSPGSDVASCVCELTS